MNEDKAHTNEVRLYLLRDGKEVRVAPGRDDGMDSARIHEEALRLAMCLVEICGPCLLRVRDDVLLRVDAEVAERIAWNGSEHYRGAMYSPKELDLARKWWSDQAEAPREESGVKLRDVGDGVFEEIFE